MEGVSLSVILYSCNACHLSDNISQQSLPWQDTIVLQAICPGASSEKGVTTTR